MFRRPDGDRFDRIVRVDVPEAAGREAILKVHTRKMKIDDVDVLRAVAELTPGAFVEHKGHRICRIVRGELSTCLHTAAVVASCRRGVVPSRGSLCVPSLCHLRSSRSFVACGVLRCDEQCSGLAGAELATIANEAAILAARRGSQLLLRDDFLVSKHCNTAAAPPRPESRGSRVGLLV